MPVSDQVTFLQDMYIKARQQRPTCSTFHYYGDSEFNVFLGFTRLLIIITDKDEIEGEILLKIPLLELSQHPLPRIFVDRLMEKPRYTNYVIERTVNWQGAILGCVVEKIEPGPSSSELVYHLKLDQVEDWCCLWLSEFLES